MAYTMADCTYFSDLAGDDFGWNGDRPGHRPTSKARGPLREYLCDAQGGICPACGESLADTRRGEPEFNHLVSAGPAKKGYLPGNVFAGHSACNAATKPVHGSAGEVLAGMAILAPDALARPDLIPTEWPPMPVLKARAV